MATKQQIPVVAARLTEFQEGFEVLSIEDAQWAIMNGKEAVSLSARAIANRSKPVAPADKTILSAIVATFIVPATTEKFVAQDKFKVDTGKEAKVKISYLEGDFEREFLGKVEGPFAGSIICGRKLEKKSVDDPILQELGGNETAETTLTEMYAAMAAQPNGEDGCLLNNGRANIFYIKNITGALRAVFVGWDDGGWYVSVHSVEYPRAWFAGHRVFSRNSLVPQAA
jgi:hypothetical protein